MIEVRHVSKRYGGKVAVEDVSLCPASSFGSIFGFLRRAASGRRFRW